MKQILLTGGTGYIGSHTAVALIESGYQVLLFDNLCNSSEIVLERIEKISGVRPNFVQGDIRDADALDRLFDENDIDTVVHFAALKAVGESTEKPALYYENNVAGTMALVQSMQKAGCTKIVFSSSATVYGDPETLPITEQAKLGPTNPYGHTKLMIEQILSDVSASDPNWQVSLLRYFNPVGAHASGLIGEDPNGIPNNLMPFIAQVGVGRRESLAVFGNDYDTVDGTGVRDYIHVVDLAAAHVAAMEHLNPDHACKVFNLGTGRGYSVLEMVKAFEAASEQTIAYHVAPRREGDIAESYCDPSNANEHLNWSAKLGLSEMMRDQWNWQKNNPNGYC